MRRNPGENGPEKLMFTPKPGGVNTTDFPHPEISDRLRKQLAGDKTPTSFAPPAEAEEQKRLADAFLAGWKSGRKLEKYDNPYT